MKIPKKVQIFVVAIILLLLCVAYIKCDSNESFTNKPEAKSPATGKKSTKTDDKSPPSSPKKTPSKAQKGSDSNAPESPKKTPSKARKTSDPGAPASPPAIRKDFTGVRKGKAIVNLENRFVKQNNKCSVIQNSKSDIEERKIAFAAKCAEIEKIVTQKGNVPYKRPILPSNMIHKSISYTGKKCACGAGDLYSV